MIKQLWGPVWDLMGNGGFGSVSFRWLLIKYANLVEIGLVLLLFFGGMFINLPGGEADDQDGRR